MNYNIYHNKNILNNHVTLALSMINVEYFSNYFDIEKIISFLIKNKNKNKNNTNISLEKLFIIVLLTLILDNISGCAIDALPLDFPPYIPAQKLDSSESILVRESINLLGPERIPHIKCMDNEIGMRGDLCKITSNGLKLMVPTTMKDWIAIRPGMGKVIIYDVKKNFSRQPIVGD